MHNFIMMFAQIKYVQFLKNLQKYNEKFELIVHYSIDKKRFLDVSTDSSMYFNLCESV